MKIKEFKLRFIKDDTEIKKGMNVGRHGLMPINKYGFGYVEDIKTEALGFNYGIREMDSNKLYYHHISTIQPILPVLISDDKILKGDRFYVDNGEIHTCIKRESETKTKLGRIIGENDVDYLEKWVQKIVAGPNEIGWGYNEGPPHDHNRNWKYDTDDNKQLYIEDYLPSMIHKAVKSNCKLFVVVEEICPHYDGRHKSGFILAPKLYDGKVIMDSYGLLKKNSTGHILKY